MQTYVDQKDGSQKLMNGIEKVFYYAIDMSASVAQSVKVFIENDGKHGQNGSKTNWAGMGSKLPDGYIFNLLKIGFIYRLSDGGVVSPANIGKLVTGTFGLSVAEREIRSGTLAEFFDSAIKLTDDTIDTHQEISPRSFIPLLGEEGEWIYNESFDFGVTVPATEATGQLLVCMKGILWKPVIQ